MKTIAYTFLINAICFVANGQNFIPALLFADKKVQKVAKLNADNSLQALCDSLQIKRYKNRDFKLTVTNQTLELITSTDNINPDTISRYYEYENKIILKYNSGYFITMYFDRKGRLTKRNLIEFFETYKPN